VISLGCSAVTTPVTGTPSTAVRVNEVQTGTSSSAADEFVELANPSTLAVDVSGWKVVYRSAAGTTDTTLATIPDATSLAPGAFYLIAGAAYAGVSQPAQTFSTGLAAGGGGVGIRDGAGALVDSAGWGTASNALVEGSPAPAPPASAAPGTSIARIPDGRDTDDNAVDFVVSSTATPGSANR
jgi:hypothetical protein